MRNTWASFLVGAYAAYYLHDKYEFLFPFLLCAILIGLFAYLFMKRPEGVLSILAGLMLFLILYHQIDGRTSFVENSQRLVGQGVIAEKRTYSLVLKQTSFHESKKKYTIVLDPIDDIDNYQLGQEVVFRGKVKEARPALGYLDRDEMKWDHSQGIDLRIKQNSVKPTGKVNRYYFLCGNFKEKLSQQLDEIFSPNLSTILKSMLLNDLLPDEFREVYQESGLIHLFAISGLHMGLWFLVFSEILRFVPINYYTKQILIFIILFGLLFFLGFPSGAVRVWWMLLFVHSGKLLKFQVSPFHSLFFAASMMLLHRPYLFYNDGFMMSFLAMAGIYGPGKYLQTKLSFLGKYLSESLATTLGVMICLLPYLAEYQFFMSPWTILLNILLIPVYSLILIGGAFTLALSFISKGSISLFVLLLETLSNVSFRIIDLSNRGFLPVYVPVFSDAYKLAYYLLIYLALQPKPDFKLKYRRIVLLQFIFAFLFQGLYHRHMAWDLKITLPYVDQGEAILVEHDNYRAMIDTGGSYIENYDPTKRFLLPHLNYMGITKIDDLFITHGDEDHMGGVDTVQSKLSLDTIYGYETHGPKREDIVYVDHLEFVRNRLHIQSVELPGFSSDDNDNSMPLLLSLGNFNALMTGDLSTKVEKKILPQLPELTLLKVGHHGSNTSTSEELLTHCRPKLAVLSAGFNNPYGHPHDEVMDRLDEFGVKSFQTNEDGTIEIFVRGNDLYIQTYREQMERAPGFSELLLLLMSAVLVHLMSDYLRRERGPMIESSKYR